MPPWQTEHARWWVMRRASNLQAKTYRCPICDRQLPALSEHMLLFPEGDRNRRRHAHTRCVLAARSRGELLTRDEWLAHQPHEAHLAAAGRANGQIPWWRPSRWLRR